MESKRQLQIGSLLMRNVSTVLQLEGSYIYGVEVLVSVTKVMVSPDLSLAKIYLSIYNTDNKQAVMLQIEDQTKVIKQSLAARVRKHLRRMPDISFYQDDTLDEMYRLDSLFGKLKDDGQL
jgi:ribosome-binding factor A